MCLWSPVWPRRALLSLALLTLLTTNSGVEASTNRLPATKEVRSVNPVATAVLQVERRRAVFEIAFPLEKGVGPVRAGKLCLPKGQLRGRDFVADQHEFGLIVRQGIDALAPEARARLGAGSDPVVNLRLSAIDVKLCAKSWGAFGFGDTKSLSGNARFVFAWSSLEGIGPEHEVEVRLQPQKRDALTPPAMLRGAVAQALERIASEQAPALR